MNQNESHQWRLRKLETVFSIRSDKTLQATLLFLRCELAPVELLKRERHARVNNLQRALQALPTERSS